MSSYPLLSTKNGRTWDISANAITTTGAITCNGGTQTGTFYSNNVSAIRVPNGSSTTRPTGLQGYIRYNRDTSSNFLEYFDSRASAWIPLAPSPLISSVTPNFVTEPSGTAGYYNTNPLLISGANFLQGSTVSYRDPSGVITNAPTTYFYSGAQLGATVPSAVYNPIPYKSPFSIIVTNPGNYIGILNNALTATNSRIFSISGLTAGSSAITYLNTTSGTGTTGATPFPSGSTLYTFTTTANTTSTSLFTVTPNFTGSVSYLVVAGGGSGSDDGSTTPGNGGGGAGGYLTGTISVSNGVSYSLQVGGGGAGVSGVSALGNTGANSTFASIISYGGGRGGWFDSQSGGPGGSGGGAGSSTTSSSAAGGTATPGGQGNNGGSGGTSSQSGGGGGGGAGGLGANGSSVTSGIGGNGGNGTSNMISGASILYAGGGGGSPGGTGGSGGGGNAASSAGNGVNGTPGRGGGGGASIGPAVTNPPIGNFSGSGGSGIVILRFASFS